MIANVKGVSVDGDIVYYDSSGNELLRIASSLSRVVDPKAAYAVRRRCTIAEVNAGVTLLAAIPGFKIRMLTAKAISYGGAAAAVTTVDILATQSSSSVKLAAFAQAGLTQSAVLTAGGTSGAVLADGASYVANDVNTAVTVGKTGSSVTTATGIDIIFEYALDAA